MRGDHHALAVLDTERLGGNLVDAQFRFVVSGDLGTENRVPGEVIAPGEVNHQGDVAVGAGREQVAGAQPLESGRHSGPGIEFVPGHVQFAQHRLFDFLQAEIGADSLQHAAMDDVQPGEGDAAGAHFFHAGLVFGAPGVGEGEPVQFMAERFEDFPRLARHTGAPIDQGAEDVVDEGLHSEFAGAVVVSHARSRQPRGSQSQNRQAQKKFPASGVHVCVLVWKRCSSYAATMEYSIPKRFIVVHSEIA